jgi:hypothetical protein
VIIKWKKFTQGTKRGTVRMDDFTKELKRITKKHPILTTMLLTLWIWYGSYRLGVNMGEFFADIKN